MNCYVAFMLIGLVYSNLAIGQTWTGQTYATVVISEVKAMSIVECLERADHYNSDFQYESSVAFCEVKVE